MHLSFLKLWSGRLPLPLAFIALAVIAGVWLGAVRFGRYVSQAQTRDAFLDSHLINVSANVGGDIQTMYVLEQRQVKKGELLAVIDPAVYEREVGVKRSQLAVAESVLAKAEADLKVLSEEVPRRVRVAEHKLHIAQEDEAKAAQALELVSEEVDKGIRAAAAKIRSSKAALVLADADFRRYADLFQDGSVTRRKFQEATKIQETAKADVSHAEARHAQALAARFKVAIARRELLSARHAVAEAQAALELARLGDLQIEAAGRLVAERQSAVAAAQAALQVAQTNMAYTRILAPHNGIITKKWRHAGDHVRPGDPIFNMYDPKLLYVTVHLEETLLPGINPGNHAIITVDAFDRPFRGRVLWIGSATDANFSLIPRDVSSGEFTYVVQRVTTRLALEPDERRHLLKPGLSAHVSIEPGPGDPAWAGQAWKQMALDAGVVGERR